MKSWAGTFIAGSQDVKTETAKAHQTVKGCKSMNWRWCIILIGMLFSNQEAYAVMDQNSEGVALGFPELTLPSGAHLANGVFKQWNDGGKLQIRIQFSFEDGRITNEQMTLNQEGPELIQEQWSWQELRDDQVLRRFEVDLLSKRAKAVTFETKADAKAVKKEWNETLDEIAIGQTFVGTGLSFAVKRSMKRILAGEKITRKVVAFTPKPRMVDLEIYGDGEKMIPVATHQALAKHIVIHPKVFALARIFLNIKDLHLWISKEKPHAVLRFEGPRQEPDDPVMFLNIYPQVSRN